MKPYSHPSLKSISLELVMQALSDPCRIAIVRTLLAARKREMACHEIPLQVAKATRSHHFAVLRDAGLIFTRSDGVRRMTSIRAKEIDQRFPGLLQLLVARGGKSSALPKTKRPTPPKRRATLPRPTRR